jgi:hypothetical protein
MVKHYESHLGLLGDASNETPAGYAPTLVNIPSIRGSEALAQKIETFASIPDQLLLFIIHSKKEEKDATTRLLEQYPELQWINSYLPQDYETDLTDFKADEMAEATAHREGNDLSLKRNLGLIAARIFGKSNIFWLDDDVNISAEDFQKARSLSIKSRFNAVGLINTGMPDRSVVCHAGLNSSRTHGMVSSGALAFDTDHRSSLIKVYDAHHFPNIYNEDWLFLYPYVAANRCARSGNFSQDRYDPFSQPKRAEQQEFGEIIAEGLYSILEDNPKNKWLSSLNVVYDLDYWKDFLIARRQFMNQILEESSTRNDLDSKRREAIEEILLRALEVNKTISPEACLRYIELWRQDSRDWLKSMKEIYEQPSWSGIEQGTDGARIKLGRLGLGNSSDYSITSYL